MKYLLFLVFILLSTVVFAQSQKIMIDGVEVTVVEAEAQLVQQTKTEPMPNKIMNAILANDANQTYQIVEQEAQLIRLMPGQSVPESKHEAIPASNNSTLNYEVVYITNSLIPYTKDARPAIKKAIPAK